MENNVNDMLDEENKSIELEENPTSLALDLKTLVKETYDKIDFAYGIYNPRAVSFFHPILCFLYFSVIFTFAFSFVVLYLNGIYPWGVSLWWLVVGCFIAYILCGKKYEIYFYKCKGKTVTIYCRKGNFVVYFNKKQVFQYKNGQWSKITNWDGATDNKLLFSRIKGDLEIKSKKGKMEIARQDRYGGIEFVDDNLSAIWYCPVVKVGMVKDIHSSNYAEVKVLEINTERYVEIPKSFVDFCKEQGIAPLAENEHLHYV